MTAYNNRQRKIFVITIAILLIANIAMLAVILNKKKSAEEVNRPGKKEQIVGFLKKEIGFSAQQLLQFDSVNKLHWEQNGSLYDSARNQKNEQLKMLAAENFSDTAIEKAIDKYSFLQKAMEKQLLSYIKNIRQLCTPVQIPVFDTGYIKVFNRRNDKKRKN